MSEDSEDPFAMLSVNLKRAAKDGTYYWEISVQGASSNAVLADLDKLDEALRKKYGGPAKK